MTAHIRTTAQDGWKAHRALTAQPGRGPRLWTMTTPDHKQMGLIGEDHNHEDCDVYNGKDHNDDVDEDENIDIDEERDMAMRLRS
ncbi:hypothetical protein BDZ89DRAFT_1067264 [Hymenopellis radicata]|nr:hypothetical protein BDZ89DRAFT_1067264 [Hymenopellis radicata]